MIIYFYKVTSNGWVRTHSTDIIGNFTYDYTVNEAGKFSFNTKIDNSIDIDMIITTSDTSIPAGIIESISFEPDTGFLRVAGASLLSILDRRRPFSAFSAVEVTTIGQLVTVFSQELKTLTNSKDFISCDASSSAATLSKPMQPGDRTWLKMFKEANDRQNKFHMEYDFYKEGSVYKLKYRPVIYSSSGRTIIINEEIYDGRSYVKSIKNHIDSRRVIFRPANSFIHRNESYLPSTYYDITGSTDNKSFLDRYDYITYDNFGSAAGTYEEKPYYEYTTLTAKADSELAFEKQSYEYDCVLINVNLSTSYYYTIMDTELDIVLNNITVSNIKYVYNASDSGTEVIKMYTLTT